MADHHHLHTHPRTSSNSNCSPSPSRVSRKSGWPLNSRRGILSAAARSRAVARRTPRQAERQPLGAGGCEEAASSAISGGPLLYREHTHAPVPRACSGVRPWWREPAHQIPTSRSPSRRRELVDEAPPGLHRVVGEPDCGNVGTTSTMMEIAIFTSGAAGATNVKSKARCAVASGRSGTTGGFAVLPPQLPPPSSTRTGATPAAAALDAIEQKQLSRDIRKSGHHHQPPGTSKSLLEDSESAFYAIFAENASVVPPGMSVCCDKCARVWSRQICPASTFLDPQYCLQKNKELLREEQGKKRKPDEMHDSISISPNQALNHDAEDQHRILVENPLGLVVPLFSTSYIVESNVAPQRREKNLQLSHSWFRGYSSVGLRCRCGAFMGWRMCQLRSDAWSTQHLSETVFRLPVGMGARTAPRNSLRDVQEQAQGVEKSAAPSFDDEFELSLTLGGCDEEAAPHPRRSGGNGSETPISSNCEASCVVDSELQLVVVPPLASESETVSDEAELVHPATTTNSNIMAPPPPTATSSGDAIRAKMARLLQVRSMDVPRGRREGDSRDNVADASRSFKAAAEHTERADTGGAGGEAPGAAARGPRLSLPEVRKRLRCLFRTMTPPLTPPPAAPPAERRASSQKQNLVPDVSASAPLVEMITLARQDKTEGSSTTSPVTTLDADTVVVQSPASLAAASIVETALAIELPLHEDGSPNPFLRDEEHTLNIDTSLLSISMRYGELGIDATTGVKNLDLVHTHDTHVPEEPLSSSSLKLIPYQEQEAKVQESAGSSEVDKADDREPMLFVLGQSNGFSAAGDGHTAETMKRTPSPQTRLLPGSKSKWKFGDASFGTPVFGAAEDVLATRRRLILEELGRCDRESSLSSGITTGSGTALSARMVRSPSPGEIAEDASPLAPRAAAAKSDEREGAGDFPEQPGNLLQSAGTPTLVPAPPGSTLQLHQPFIKKDRDSFLQRGALDLLHMDAPTVVPGGKSAGAAGDPVLMEQVQVLSPTKNDAVVSLTTAGSALKKPANSRPSTQLIVKKIVSGRPTATLRKIPGGAEEPRTAPPPPRAENATGGGGATEQSVVHDLWLPPGLPTSVQRTRNEKRRYMPAHV